MSSSYARPRESGGRLIRSIKSQLSKAGIPTPIASDILIAVSGGPDSVALAHVLAKYGRRVVPKDRITLLHFNHRWRGAMSEQDAWFVEDLAEKLGVRFKKAEAYDLPREDSREEEARYQRKTFFAQELASSGASYVLTAHHLDDQAETLLWRILTGQGQSHGGGILPLFENELRPLLGVRKTDLLRYLREEEQDYREDISNKDPRYLRNQIRKELMPKIEALFPRAVEHLGSLAAAAQSVADKSDSQEAKSGLIQGFRQLLSVAGLDRKLRAENWREIAKLKDGAKAAQLPGGWRISRLSRAQREMSKITAKNAWILEKASLRGIMRGRNKGHL